MLDRPAPYILGSWREAPLVLSAPHSIEDGVLMRQQAIENALAAWLEAERTLSNATNGDRGALQADVDRHRNQFQRLSAAHMEERIGALREAESRRRLAVPSTPQFHAAAVDEKAIAAEIWDSARQSDDDTPQTDPQAVA